MCGSSRRMSTTSTIGQPARSCPRDVVSSAPAPRASSDGHGEVITHGTPARRARSSATSRACHVGACSCWWASSCSSTTTIAARPPTGAQAAARVPTTVAPAAPCAQSRGWPAMRTPACRRVRATRVARGAVGHRTSACPRRAAASATAAGSVAGGSRSTARPRPRASSARRSTASPVRADGPPPTGVAGGRAATFRSGDAVRRNDAGRPAQRHAAQWASSIRSGPGPRPDHRASGRRSTPAGGSTPSSTIHPPTRRGPRATRTRSPTRTWPPNVSGTR